MKQAVVQPFEESR